MKTTGYYFCDHCEENAFGPQCQTCRRPAEFHPAPLPAVPALPPAPRRVTATTAAAGFQQIRAAIAKFPTAL